MSQLLLLFLCYVVVAIGAPLATTRRETSTGEDESALHDTLPFLDAVWPVEGTPRTSISSTFGPRILLSGNRYDFHRGIDISAKRGTPVLAALSGRLYGTRVYNGGGNTVILDHDVDVYFHGEARTKMHTFYMHLDSFAGEIEGGEAVEISAGDIIGYVGDTGQAVHPHLHFELRVGSRCSLEHQIETNNCVVGYDPHVHPLGLFEKPTQDEDQVSLNEVSPLSETLNGVIEVSAPDRFPVANRYEVHLHNEDETDELVAVMDLNLREGFIATSRSELDNPVPVDGMPYIIPYPFGVSADTWRVVFVIPAGLGSKETGQRFKVVVKNVFNDAFEMLIGDPNESW